MSSTPLAITGPQVCWNRTTSSCRACSSIRLAVPVSRPSSEVAARGRACPAGPRPGAAGPSRPRAPDGVDRRSAPAVARARRTPGRRSKCDEQLDDHLVQRAAGVVAQSTSSWQMPASSSTSRCTSAYCPCSTTSRLASSTTGAEVGRFAGELGVQAPTSGAAPAGSTNSPPTRQQRVVPGGAGARPVVGQLLVALEDLLDHDPGAAGRARPADAGSRAGRPARPGGRSAGRRPCPRAPGEQQRVGRVEDLRVLHPDRGQGVDVEEPPVVELLVRDPPVREPVPLLGRPARRAAGPRCPGGPGTRGRSSAARLAVRPVEGSRRRASTLPMRWPSTGISSGWFRRPQSTSNHAAYGEAGPSRSTDHSAALSRRRRRHRHVVGHDVRRPRPCRWSAQAVRPAGRTPAAHRPARTAGSGRRRRTRASSRARPAGRGQVGVRDPEAEPGTGTTVGGVVEAEARRAAAAGRWPVGTGRSAARPDAAAGQDERRRGTRIRTVLPAAVARVRSAGDRSARVGGVEPRPASASPYSWHGQQ